MRLLVAAQVLLLLSLAACARLGSPQGWSGGVVAEGALYIGTMEGDLRALATSTGETIWSFELRGESEDDRVIYGPPTISDDTLYFGGYDGHLYALTLDGDEVWETRVGNGDHIVGGPVVADGLVLVGSSDGNLYTFDAVDGSQRWTFPTGNKVWSTPAVEEGVAYFGSLDHNVYAVSLEDGTELWRFPAKAAVTARPVVAGGRVFVGSFGSVFYAIDAETGSEVWRFDGASRWYWGGAIADGETIYAPSLDGTLYALDMGSGRLNWTLDTEGSIVGSPVIVGDRIAVPSSDGRVWLARLTDGAGGTQCDIGSKLRASLAEHEGYLYVAASDHSVRRLLVKPNGNPDEEWVHLTDKGDPVQHGRPPAC